MPPAEDEPGRLACADDLSSEEGRLVPAPDPMSQRNALRPPSLRRMIMRTPPVTRLAIVAITVLAAACAACSSAPASPASPGSGGGAGFPITVTTTALCPPHVTAGPHCVPLPHR